MEKEVAMFPKTGSRHRGRSNPKRGRKKRKLVADAVQFAVSHHTRLEILILLHEAAYTTSDLAELTGIDIKKISNHLLEMFNDGSIEVVDSVQRHGTTVYWYRAVEMPEYSKEEAEALPEKELQGIAGVIAQGQTAELMAALHKGTLATARTILSWDMYDVDKRGREDIEEITTAYLERLTEVQCESANRVAESKEETTPMIVSVGAFRRARAIRVSKSRTC